LRRTALVGNPNCGKTTLFNRLTGLQQHTSNLPGTTVEAHHGKFKLPNETIELIDLPGIYSLFAESDDEKLVVQHLLGEGVEKPDAILLVLDSSNLRRNLLLQQQLQDLGYPTAAVLTMQDSAKRRGLALNISHLEKQLGLQILGINPRKDRQLAAPISLFLEKLLNTAAPELPPNDTESKLQRFHSGEKIKGLSLETLLRYNRIESILSACQTQESFGWKSFTLKLDRWFVHPVVGFLAFFAVMMILFQGVFTLAEGPMTWVEDAFAWASAGVESFLPQHKASGLITDGLLPGLAGVVVFVPQIFILFFLIGLLEDSGYMVRASFITDRLMRKIGLNGRSVIPLVGGFACAIPAMMATRSIRNRSERLATMIVVPLMSCSARLPVYVLLISLAIPAQQFIGPVPAQTLVMTSAYFAGIIVALLIAALFKKFHPSQERSEFILELPAYQRPRLQTVAQQAWMKCKSFLQEAGSVILIISVALWALSTWGPGDSMNQAKIKAEQAVQELECPEDLEPSEFQSQLESTFRLEASYAGHIGHAIEPAIEPLGYDWKTGIALISSFAAREVFVGTMSTLFQSSDGNVSGIRARMQKEIDPHTGKPKYGIAYALSLIIFYAFALQCISTMAVMKKETGSWTWPISLFLLYGAMAYLGAFIVYRWSLGFLV